LQKNINVFLGKKFGFKNYDFFFGKFQILLRFVKKNYIFADG